MKVPNMTARLHELRCPVFGFWGVNDQFNPVGGAMKIVEQRPQARMVLVNRCGHWVQVEHREMFNRAVHRLSSERLNLTPEPHGRSHLPRPARSTGRRTLRPRCAAATRWNR
jgi:hypothetical protein